MIAGIEKFLAVTRGTAKVGHQYHIATICEELSQRVVAPVVASPRSAVRQHKRGKIFGCNAPGQQQICWNFQPIGGLVRDRLHLGQVLTRQFFPNLELRSECAGLAIEKISLARLGGAYDVNEPKALITCSRNHHDFILWILELALDPVDVIAERFFLVIGFCASCDVPGLDQFVRRFGEQRSAKINLPQGVRFHCLGFSGLRVHQRQ